MSEGWKGGGLTVTNRFCAAHIDCSGRASFANFGVQCSAYHHRRVATCHPYCCAQKTLTGTPTALGDLPPACRFQLSAVEASGRKCFDGAGARTGPSRDVKVPAWIHCYYATILGPKSNTSYDRTGGWTKERLGSVWEGAFTACPAVVFYN